MLPRFAFPGIPVDALQPVHALGGRDVVGALALADHGALEVLPLADVGHVRARGCGGAAAAERDGARRAAATVRRARVRGAQAARARPVSQSRRAAERDTYWLWNDERARAFASQIP